MAIYIVRKTGWLGSGSKIHVLIDGVRRGEVYGNSPVEFQVAKNEAAVKVTQLGIRSKEKVISDGMLLEIHQSLWHRISFPVMIVAQFLTVFVSDFMLSLILLLALGVLFIGSLYVIPGFHLKKVSDDINDQTMETEEVTTWNR
ncbi:hypothetical protein [Proteiniclasticum ruminis]|uniref:Uncharacterized protein n=1 Tax=Proteiniclasticum ruminis TaxID=398199 RepID=A0A1I5DVA0_9CLOT|nr:hypothetical protein [Proteiniclasticum ruminis]SFO03106.1 hypothetical protein SAMN04488695_11134 [Proteiniclasticum ruminis]